MDIPEHCKLFQYGTLINCAITNADKLFHYRTPISCAIMKTFINTMQFCDCDSNATGISTKFRNIYEQLDNTHISVPEDSYQK